MAKGENRPRVSIDIGAAMANMASKQEAQAAQLAALLSKTESQLEVASDIVAADVELFVVSGGPVLAELYGVVTGAIGAGPVTCTLEEDCDSPVATIALTDAGDIASAAEGSTIHYTNADPGITTIDADGAYSANPRCQVLLVPGTVVANYSADETGEITWYIRYWPVSPNAEVAVVAP